MPTKKPGFSLSMNSPLPRLPELSAAEEAVATQLEAMAEELDEPESALEELEDTELSSEEPEITPISAKRRGKFRTKRDMKILVDSLREMQINGESDATIAEKLDLTKGEFRRVKLQMYEEAIEGVVDKPAEMQYVDYRLEQERCIREFDDMAKHFKKTKQFNAMVGAVRAKSQILENIHKTGVQMGVIKKETDYDKEINGVKVKDLENQEVRELVAKELDGLKSVIEKFGDQFMTEVKKPSPMVDPTIERVKH